MVSDYRLPLGKHKGKPLREVVYLDPDYCEWLIRQSELLVRYPAIARAFSELGVTGDQTPLHNALQALFLETEVCWRLINRIWGATLTLRIGKDLLHRERIFRIEKLIGKVSDYEPKRKRSELLAEIVRYKKSIDELFLAFKLDDDALVSITKLSRNYTGLGRIVDSDPDKIRQALPHYIEREKRSLQESRESLAQMRRSLVQARLSIDEIEVSALQYAHKQDFRRMEEFNGSDVHFRYVIEASLPDRNPMYPDATKIFDVWVEIKPYVSDDYPSILRQMDVQRKLAKDRLRPESQFVVVVGKFGAHGATLKQVRQMFVESGFNFVLLEEIGCEFPVVPPSSNATPALPLFSN